MTELAGRAIHRIIIPAFRSKGTLNASEATALSQIRWDLQSYNMNLFDTRAKVEDGKRVVIISAGMADLIYALSYDWILSTNMGMDHQFEQYLPFVMQKIRENQQLAVEGYQPKPVPRFVSYAHLSVAEIEARIPSPAVFNAVIPLTVDGLAFICGHELGHHVYHDVDPDRDASGMSQRDREARADRFSLSLCLRSDFSPIGAVPLFAVFMASGEEPTHPPPECRLYDFLGPSMDALQRDPRFSAYLRANPDAARKLRTFPQMMSQFRSMLPASCR